MKHHQLPGLLALCLLAAAHAPAEVRYVDVNSTSPTPPYTNWVTAATKIQDAVDVSISGDIILVTNGVYASGGRALVGSMTNRVAVTNALTLRSVNGPQFTIIQGYQVPGTINGDGAIRCVFLTNGATLAGFTVTSGATRTSGNLTWEQSGGGVCCASTNALVTNCLITANAAARVGGGIYSGTLKNCAIAGNSASSGGGIYSGALNNCTLTGNAAGSSGGGASSATLKNCILYYNTAGTGSNYSGGTLTNCCTTPLPGTGTGNISAEPRLASASHLSAGSPCGGAGSTAFATGLDIDGEAWLSPPSIGCDEYQAGAVTGDLTVAVGATWTTVPVGVAVDFTAWIDGHPSDSVWDFGDGTVLSNRPYASHSWEALGDYPVVLRAYNESHPEGVSTTVTVQVVTQSVYYVSVASPNPVPPYFSWATAARTIQAAVDAAPAGATVLVTNGVYSTGGRAVYGLVTNRVAVAKAVVVQSVNGPAVTTIRGYQVPGTTNGDGAMRCAYLTNGAVLSGFTLNNGATRTSGDGLYEQSGGGVLCESTNALVTNCTLTANSAYYAGGGAYAGTLNTCALSRNSADQGGGVSSATLTYCTLTTNSAQYGGGASYSTLDTCALTGNSSAYGGGAYAGSLNYCTLTGDSASQHGGGADSATLNNCRLSGNASLQYGGGASDSTLETCALTGNSAGYGGGAYSGALNKCSLTANSASQHGGGAFSATLHTCTLTDNRASQYGGGTYSGTLINCALTGNSAAQGGGASFGTLMNCTLTGNSATSGGGGYYATLNNCILFYNRANNQPNYDIYSGLNYCCTTPLPGSGTGNITDEPQLASDSHLSAASPCRGAGSAAYATGLDIDGEAWLNPPSIGCDEYHAGAVTGDLTLAITASWTNVLAGFVVDLTGRITGRVVASAWDFGDGTILSNQPYASHAWGAVGDYTVALWAFNESHPEGVSATLTIRVVAQPVHHVWAASASPVSPYTSWETAAHTIQEAVDATTVPGALVLVTNGAYATVGRAVGGLLTNRLAVTKAVVVQSLNGPAVTAIRGYQVPGTTNGDRAIRCVYLTNGAALSGFTLTNGATRSAGDVTQEQSGGGVWCESTNVLVTNCTLTANSAYYAGGGAYSGTLNGCALTGNSSWQYGGGASFGALNHCTLTANSATYGGGAWAGALSGCTLTDNSASQYGGGAYSGWLNNCTLTGNSATSGGGAYYAALNNCILYYNRANDQPDYDLNSVLNYCCTTPLPGSGTGNITDEPQLASASRLSAGSPCRGAGSAAYATDLDIDGEAWLNPPSIGCDEYHAGALTGDLTVSIGAAWTNVAVGFGVDLTGRISGRVAASAWDFGDGTVLSNRPYASHSWGAAGDYPVKLWAYNESHPEGVSATLTIRVVAQPVHYVSAVSASPASPYTSWASASRTIQGAVDAATVPGALVLVTNGVYANGGRAVFGTMTNRVAVTKPLLVVRSVNGPEVTAIQGRQVPGTTNGDGAIRCVYLTNGAVLSGFTLTNGATRAAGDINQEQSGGGVWCESANALVTNCTLRANSAYAYGGGAYNGTLNNCTLTGNSAIAYGGGAYSSSVDGTLDNCTLTGNSATYGGGTYSGTLNNCTLATNSASQYGGGAYSGTLSNCTLTGNTTSQYGGGAYGSTLHNCMLTGNSAYSYGGGAYSSTLHNCMLTANSAGGGGGAAESTLNTCTLTANSVSQSGGGAYSGTLNRCTLTGNSSQYDGGGTSSGTLNNCTLTANSAQYGGGASYGTLNNCTLTANSASGSGGGAYAGSLNNCTLTGNSAYQGGGAYYGALNNCILYYNRANNQPNYAINSSLNYCCTTPAPGSGTHNITDEPQLATRFHLSASSPCRGAGSAAYATGLDIDGEAWLNPPSIGCDEYHSGALTGDLTVALGASWTNMAVGFVVDFTASISGQVTASSWDFGDGTILSNRPYASHAWAVAGEYTVVLWAYNESHPEGVSATLTARVVAQPVHYVWAASDNPVPPYRSWATAATNIQDAMDAATVPGALVLVTNGVYASGGRAVFGTMTNRVAVDRPVELRSVNGPEVTVIQGYQVPGTTNGDGAIRCVYLTNGAVLNGFTLTHGATRDWQGDLTREQSGGGVWCESANALVTNCTLRANSAYAYGGGAYNGALNNCALNGNSAGAGGGAYFSSVYGSLNTCTLTGNSAFQGGGAYSGTLNQCTLTVNSATQGGGACSGILNNCRLTGNSAADGGGAYSGTLNQCMLTANSASQGGGAYSGILNNCAVTGNSASQSGGGTCFGTVNNCALTGNSAWQYGGGTYEGALNQSTLTGNSAFQGGGAYRAALTNCVLYYNRANHQPNYAIDAISGSNFIAIPLLNFCCTTPLPSYGTGNITEEPQLASASHLSATSPCRGAGSAAAATGLDIDGETWLNPPSIGCDEYHADVVTGDLTVSIGAAWTNVASGYVVDFTAFISGRVAASAWDFGDGTVLSNRPYATHTWGVAGDYTVVLRAYNESHPEGVSATLTIHVVAQPVHYVWGASASPVPPYTSWRTAAHTIQEAVDAVTVPGALVLVTNGVYASGGRAVVGTMTNRVAVDRPVELRSVNGPEATVIQGYQVPGTTHGDGAIRCVYLTHGAVLNGFTLTHGATRTAGDDSREQNGGGVWCESANAQVTNCTLTANSANFDGGGAYSGTLNNCTFTGNSASHFGGGAYASTLNYCALMANSAYYVGGGAWAGMLNHCTLTGNSAQNGGGASGDPFNLLTLNQCTLTSNSASGDGGGAYSGTLNDCTLTGNSGSLGGGVSGGTLNNCTLSGNSAYNFGGGASFSTLSNCTLTGNRASQYGGGTYSGTLNNCALTGNSAAQGGGASFGTLMNCTLTGNSASQSGGGASSSALNNCGLTGNSASQSGGGASSSTLNNCGLTANWASQSGGGASSSALNNCGLTANSASQSGGGVSGGLLNNCTLTGNSATYGGGAFSSTVNNCILYYNQASSDPNYSSSTLNSCCTTPLPSYGLGNTTAEPQLAGAFRLSAGSPCRGAGSAAYATGLDIDGEAWLNPPSIGCDEYHAGDLTGDLSVSIGAAWTNVAVGFGVDLTGQVSGRVAASAWDFGDGTILSNRPYASHAWATAGDYTVVLWAYKESHPEGVSATLTVRVVAQPVHYVWAASASPTPPYSSWATAAPTMQDAVDAATVPGALVLVTNGVYAGGGRAVFGTMTNRVAVDRPVELRSVNGPEVTVIQGYQVPDTTNGDGAIRCVYLTNGAVLSGFTLTRGATRTAGDSSREQSGGGVCGESAHALVKNCTLTDNSASQSGGGAFHGTLNNCTLSGNSAQRGGGASSGTLNNCTLAGNSALQCGGGAYGSALNNSILYYNTAFAGANNYDTNSVLNHCCTTPLPAAGAGNIIAEPLFVDANGWSNLRLQSNSPGINAGDNSSAAGGTDLDGRPRIVDGTVDMGAYEFQPGGSGDFIGWLSGYGLPTDGSADFTDTDADGLTNWEEWQAGTVPTNALSTLRMLNPTNAALGITVTWQSVTNRTYFLERATNLAAVPPFSLLASNLVGPAGTTSYTDTNAPGPGPFFYRVGVQP